jgi:hypothetical protein
VDKTLLDSRIDDFIDDRVTEFAFVTKMVIERTLGLADWKPLTWISL